MHAGTLGRSSGRSALLPRFFGTIGGSGIILDHVQALHTFTSVGQLTLEFIITSK